MKLELGTVQFGLDYGITNRDGKITKSEALKIIKVANDANILLFDTANAYGDSEAVLGKLTQAFPKIQFISKIAIQSEQEINIQQTVQESLNKLRCSSL